MSAVKLCFCSSLCRYGVKYAIQSLVFTLGVFLNQSRTISSVSSIRLPLTSIAGPAGLRFLGFGCPPSFDVDGTGAAESPLSSVALRLLPTFGELAAGLEDEGDVGLVIFAEDPLATGGRACASGLVARGIPLTDFGLGALGLVARFATTE